MRPPLAPESLDALLQRHSASLLHIIRAWHSPIVGGRYLPWERLLRRKAPGGLSPDQWWLAIKLSRNFQFRPLPFQGRNGKPSLLMLPGFAQDALHQIDAGIGGWGLPDSPDEQEQFIVNARIHEAIASSRLAGASAARAEAAELLRSGRRPRDRAGRMIGGAYRAMQAAGKMKDKRLSLDALIHLNATITNSTRNNLDRPADIGRVHDRRNRGEPDGNGRNLPPGSPEMTGRMQEMIRFANQEDKDRGFMHPIVRAIVLHFWLACDKPFAEGNRRTARVLFYWCVLRCNYPVFEFVSLSWYLQYAPIRYARSFLHAEVDGNDLTYFLAHQVEVLLRAVKGARQHISGEKKKLEMIAKMIGPSAGLNARQLALLAHGLRNPAARYTVRWHRTTHNVSTGTARSDLLGLAENGLLERKRSDGKSYAYVAPPDLKQRIRRLHGQSV